MKSIIIFTATLLALTATSCKKDKSPALPSTPVSFVKTVSTSTNGASASFSTYEYNTDKKISKINYDDGAYCNFIYTGQTIVSECFDKNGVSSVKLNYNLNSAGLVATLTLNTSPATINYYEFNAAKQLVHITVKNNDVIQSEYFYKYNSAGNKITDSLINTNGTSINQYEYYTDKISTTEQKNYGQPFYGVGSKNCVKSISLKSSGGLTTFSPYGVPVLDASGRIAQTSLTYFANNSVYNYTYY